MFIIFFGVYMYMQEQQGPRMPVWTGETMGTTYSIKIVNSSLDKTALAELKRTAEAELESLNQRFFDILAG